MVGGRLEAWSLDCRRAPLRDDLGPPDFYPPSVGCLEDALDETSVQNGWKDSAEDLNVSEAKESALTLASAADLWEGSRVRGHRKRLWQSLHLLQKSKRAAQGASSQVILQGDPLSRPLPVPEQRPAGPGERRRWMRDLGGSRDLAQLVETVPLGLIRQTLFEALYENSVPFCRALWLIRIVYLNLVKPLPPSGLPQTGGERGGGPAIGGGPGKGPGQRSFAFTQHLVEFLGSVLQEDGPQASPLPLSAKQQDEGGAAEKWSYALRLAGGAHREGIMDVGLLVDWLLERLHEVAGSGPQKGVLAEGLASLLLLTAKDLSASQALTRMAVKVIKETLRLPHLQPDASKPPSPSSRLRQTLVTIARRLLSDAPDVLCAVNLGKASDSSPFGPPGGPLAAVRRKTDALSSAVCPPVLEWDEAGAMAALEATMASGSLEDALNALPLRHGKEEAVVVVARWACRRSDLSASPSGGQANGDGEGEGKEGWGCRAVAAAVAARRLFACHLLQRTTEGKDKKRKDVAVSGSPPGVNGPPSLLQGALERWIGCSKWTDIDEASAAAALVIALAERRLFCPSLYLSNLLADGSIEGAAGEGEAANSHVSMLQHLHHRMHFLAQGPSEEDRGLVPVSPSVYEKNRRMALQKAKGVGYDTSRRAAKRQKRELVGKAGEGSAEGAYVPSLRLMIARALGIEASTALGSAPPPKGWDGISAEALAGRLARLPPWKRRRLGAWLEDMVLEAFKGGCPSQTDSQELPPDLMLLRAVALLDAADSHAAASRLLLSLLEDHSRAAAASSAQAALRFPKGRKVMTEALLAALRSRLDLLSSDLLLLRAVKASIGWLFEEGVSHSLAGANGDLMMAFGAELLESSAPSVTSWWEEKSLSAGHQQWAVMTVQRMRQSSAGRLEALQQLVEALQAALSRSPVLRLGLEACQALRCPGGDPLEAAGCLWRWASEADRPKSCGAALLVCGVIAESAVRALALEMSSRGGGGRGLLPSKAALCRHRHLRALSHVRELSEGGDDISAYIVAAALRTRAADASREVGMFLSGAILYGQAVLQDALQLTGSLGGLEAPIWAGSLLGRASMRGADFGEAAVMRGLQVQLSLEAAHLALARTLEPAVISGRSLATKDLLEHLPIRLCALKDPWRLYHLLVERKGLQPYDIGVDRCHSLPSRLLVWSLVEGRLYSMAEAELATPQERQAEMAGLLQDLSPSNFELYCLKLRLLLDEQVLLDKLNTLSAAEALKVASKAFAEAEAGRLSEAEKQLSNSILAALPRRPNLAALFGELAVRLGSGVGEHLLQQVDLFFQDPASTRNPSQSQLFGRVSLLQVLRKRVDALGADEGGGDLSPEPFALESALATLALSILKRSSGSKQKEFADQLVRQLSCLGEVLSSGDSSAPKSIRRVNSGGAIGWGRTLSIRANEIDAVPGPPAAVQVAVWMRLQVLLPLLPVVYSDREPDPKKNLRDVLSVALVQLLGSPAARADPWLGSQDPSASAATAAATAAGDSLFSRLLAVLHGLLGGQWATWLSRYSKDKLRDVPPFENTAQLSQAVSGVRLPPHLAHRLLSSLPLPSAPSLSIPSAAPPPRPFSIPGSGLAPPQRERSDGPAPGEPSAAPHMTTAPHQQGTVMDPWQLLETAASGNPRRDPHWLAGAQRVRRRALTYAVDMDLQADATALIATKQSPCSGQQQSQQSLESRVEGAPVAQERCP